MATRTALLCTPCLVPDAAPSLASSSLTLYHSALANPPTPTPTSSRPHACSSKITGTWTAGERNGEGRGRREGGGGRRRGGGGGGGAGRGAWPASSSAAGLLCRFLPTPGTWLPLSQGHANPFFRPAAAAHADTTSLATADQQQQQQQQQQETRNASSSTASPAPAPPPPAPAPPSSASVPSPSVSAPPPSASPASAPSPSAPAPPPSAAPALPLCCPICHTPFKQQPYSLSVASRRSFSCGACGERKFSSGEGFVDTVIASGAKEYVEPVLAWAGSSTFRSPLVSFVYERGWRQNFATAGFPGPDEEWSMAQDALAPAHGQPVVDVSCGSGLFTRRMASSGLFPLVVALDFSESMLRQTKDFILTSPDKALRRDRIALVRADVARLPFATGSVAGIHAGAALHCWPSPSLAVAEISRVLKPGGVFVASTFLSPSLPFGDELVKPLRKEAMSRSGVYKFWELEELQELLSLAGFQGFTCTTRKGSIFYGDFILLSATRFAPSNSSST